MEILGEAIARKIVTPPLDMEAIRATRIPDPVQTKTVGAGKREEVFYFAVPKGNVFWIQRIANNYYESCYLYWWVDGKLVISPYVEWQIAFVNNPAPLVPWLRVNEYVRWEAKNDGVEDVDMEVLCDGVYVPLEDIPLMLRLGLPISR